MTALSDGAQYVSGTAKMPDMDALMTTSPQVSDMLEGGRLVTLNFTADLSAQLDDCGIPMNCFLAAITDTLMTFIPSVTAVKIQIGTEVLTQTTSPTGTEIRFTDGVLRRSAFESFLMDQAVIYMAKDQKMVAVRRNLPAGNTASPRVLLKEMMQGATQQEQNEGIQSILPDGLHEEDILGLSLQDDTLLINLSAHAASAIRLAGSEREQLACYGMVNTLCKSKNVRRVIFFFDGSSVNELAGSLDWGGAFFYCPGLIAKE